MKTKSVKVVYALFAVIFAAMIVLFAAFASGCKDSDSGEFGSQAGNGLVTGDRVEDNSGEEPDSSTDGSADNSAQDELSKSLVISIDKLTTNAQYYQITVDGTFMEVIAYKTGSTFHTAFNTCAVCYKTDPRHAYFVQSGSRLVCQSCGVNFDMKEVGTKAIYNSCNPYPILSSDRTYTGTSLIIPYSFLVKCKNIFALWKDN